MKKQKILKRSLIIAAIVLIALTAGMTYYVKDYYHATPQAMGALTSNETVTVRNLDKNTLVFEPAKKECQTGFIFYPGGKVQYESYASLMQSLAEKGIVSILVHMPCNLAVLDMNAANGLQDKFPEIQNWYIGGHSLGGSMAAFYLAKNVKDYEGLVLLGSYSTVDLNNTNLKVISIYGTKDKVLNMQKYEKNKKNLPKEFVEKKIEGGCHAYFGSYGEQSGDGEADITEEEQKKITADMIADYLLK
ncbi:MAG TPA: hypothetical protein DCW90_19605 [Lachnospiraceae bacterium]|nr:alpha/beta hydrolase [uncultured Lachnoclostridium sp.]HAU87610.1 hypothetical protein [Lachnospiraceae bacterium]